MTINRGKFWMVVGDGTPYHRHPSKQSAKNEAERLARLYTGKEFTVVESLATVVKSDLAWELNDIDGSVCGDDIPF